ncbi:MAG: peptide ABC transporter substrate-binding protein [Rectinema sp.]|uniref:ABC-type transporter, periplasmic subunit n=1 Tax=uncultured spirochete TaxID=156406 RepID=A0A3P3XQC5_9SPIR|nr:ABC-type transporter, periplasmic subunit [uncultured spirochete]
MKRSLFVLLALLAFAGSAFAQDFIIANGAEPSTLDPALMQDTTSNQFYLAMFEGLVQYDPRTSKGIPAMAESWTTSPDGMTVTFKLRDAKWSDGTPVTAQDFVYGWLRTLAPETASNYAYMLGMVVKGADDYNAGKGKAEDVGVKAIDSKTLQVQLVGPAPYFVDMTAHSAFAPAPKWTIEKYGDQWTKPGNIVVNGPYILKEWKPQDYVLVEKNNKYWDAKNVKLRTIKYLASDSMSTNYKMFKAGAVDWMNGIDVSMIDEIKLRKDYQASAQFATYYINLNNQREPFNDVRVRRAFAAAIDKKTLVDKVLKGGQIPTDEFSPPMAGYTPQPGQGYDPAVAKKLLADAGYPDGKGFPSLTYIYNTNAGHKLIAEYVQQQLKTNLNVDIVLQNMEFKTLIEMRNKHDFTIARDGWVGDYLDPNTMLELFISDSGNNSGDHRNPAFDKLMEDARMAKGDARMKMLEQAEKILLQNDQAIIPLYHYANQDMIDTSRWGGWFANPIGYHPPKFIYKK